MLVSFFFELLRFRDMNVNLHSKFFGKLYCISINCKSQSNLLISMFRIDEQNTEKLIIKKKEDQKEENCKKNALTDC